MDFSYSKSLCCPESSIHISAQSNFQFGRRCPLKNFKMAALAAVLDMDCDNILEILNINIVPSASDVVSAKTDYQFKRSSVFFFFFFFFFFFLVI